MNVQNNGEIAASLNTLAAVFENLESVIIIIDPDTREILFANKKLYSLLGIKTLINGKKCWELMACGESPCPGCQWYPRGVELESNKLKRWEVHNERLRKWFSVDSAIVPWHDGRSVILQYYHDITDKKYRELEAKRIAGIDTVTGLPNRQSMCDILLDKLQKSRESGSFTGVLLIDVDSFKDINATLGYENGNMLLKYVAERLVESMPENILGRTSRDEFIMLCTGIHSLYAMGEVAQQIMDLFQVSFNVSGHICYITVCLGISMAPLDGDSAHELISSADIALGEAKKRGKSSYAIFQDGMRQEVRKKAKIESELRQGIEQRQFVLYYQPIVSGKTLELTGSEALLRWEHPTRGLLGPGEFVDIAEQTGLIIDLGAYVIREACRQVGEWNDMGLKRRSEHLLTVSINIASKQFAHDSFLKVLLDSMEAYNVAPQQISLEITENVATFDFERVSSILSLLRGLGINVVVDDFGTGYSSLNYMRKLAIQGIKVDRTFLMGVPHDEKANDFLRSVISLAHSFGFYVISEGVTDERQFRLLREYGCDMLQGFLFSHPLPASVYSEILRSGIKTKLEGLDSITRKMLPFLGNEPSRGPRLNADECEDASEMLHSELSDFLDLERLQKCQNIFYRLTNLYSEIKNLQAQPITRSSKGSKFCSLLISTEEGKKRCLQNSLDFGKKSGESGEPFFAECCGLGLSVYAAPIFAGKNHLANWTICQCKTTPVEKREVMGLAYEIGVEPSALLAAYEQLPEVPAARLSDAVNFVWELTRELSSTAYKARQLHQEVNNTEQNRRRMELMLYTDALLDIPNRARCGVELPKYLEQARVSGGHGVVLFLDLDNFKSINDTYGHNIGDLLLKGVAGFLKSTLGESIYRMGGDEFVAIMDGLSDSYVNEKIADLLRRFRMPWEIDGKKHYVTLSIGCASYPTDGSRYDEIINNADKAMYRAKKDGKNGVAFFNNELDAGKKTLSTAEKIVRQAIEDDFKGFRIMYQPILSAARDNLVAVEAITDLHNPGRDMVWPHSFTEAIEDSGLLNLIEDWALTASCEQVAAWHKRGHCPHLAINASVRQVCAPDFVDNLRDKLKIRGLSPSLLEIELSGLGSNCDFERAAQAIVALQSLGVKVMLDDYGNNYASLTIFSKLPVDGLKYNSNLTQGIPQSAVCRALATALMNGMREVGLVSCICGIDSENALQALKGLKFDRIQGSLAGRPMTAKLFEALYLRKNV